MKDTFDSSVAASRFNIRQTFSYVFNQPSHNRYHLALLYAFTPKEITAILQGLLRFSFYIELVKQPAIETTKFTVRWADELASDPRFCSYEGCLAIFDKLLTDLETAMQDVSKVRVLKLVASYKEIAYDINVDYVNPAASSIHSESNVHFFWGASAEKAYLLRKYLLNPSNHQYYSFFKKAYKKVAVKACLTDRVLIGQYKTNREKRWECHPASVHFALRQECLEIEYKLMKQICHFSGFPSGLQELLAREQVLVFEAASMNCPITLSPLSFELFNSEITQPRQGRSSFQVGHMHPLRAIGEGEHSGHTADNISWISALGNRIQGDLSVQDTKQVIIAIYQRYMSAGLSQEEIAASTMLTDMDLINAGAVYDETNDDESASELFE